jgi:hypothetical protein
MKADYHHFDSIWQRTTLAEAEEFVKTDPTVTAGIFVYDMAKFYGSAALMQVNEVHKTLVK